MQEPVGASCVPLQMKDEACIKGPGSSATPQAKPAWSARSEGSARSTFELVSNSHEALLQMLGRYTRATGTWFSNSWLSYS